MSPESCLSHPVAVVEPLGEVGQAPFPISGDVIPDDLTPKQQRFVEESLVD